MITLKHLDRDGDMLRETITHQEAQMLLRLGLAYVESGMGDQREFMPSTDYDLCKAVLRHERQQTMLRQLALDNA